MVVAGSGLAELDHFLRGDEMISLTALAMNAAAVLDRTHNIGERGPRTFNARQRLAIWLDTNQPGNLAQVRKDIATLRATARLAELKGGQA